MVSLRYLKGGNHFHSFEYSYDESGNRNQLIDTPENTANQVVWDYLYDWLNRLSYVWRDSLAISAYDYDESDNRTQWLNPETEVVWTYGFDIADRIQSRNLGGIEYETFVHDDDGNMISRTLTGGATTTYAWDSDNRLRLVEEDSTFLQMVYSCSGKTLTVKNGMVVNTVFMTFQT